MYSRRHSSPFFPSSSSLSSFSSCRSSPPPAVNREWEESEQTAGKRGGGAGEWGYGGPWKMELTDLGANTEERPEKDGTVKAVASGTAQFGVNSTYEWLRNQKKKKMQCICWSWSDMLLVLGEADLFCIGLFFFYLRLETSNNDHKAGNHKWWSCKGLKKTSSLSDASAVSHCLRLCVCRCYCAKTTCMGLWVKHCHSAEFDVCKCLRATSTMNQWAT